jgi:D-3-phosphoglycerate dehydrogenase
LKKVLLECKIHQDGVDLLTESDIVAEVIGPVPDHDRVQEILGDGADALITSSALQVTEAVMAASPQLQVVGRPGVGVDNIDLAGASRQGVVAVYTPDAPTESTAEHTVALLLAVAKRIRIGDKVIRESGFKERRTYVGTEVLGKTLGIVGLGRIGSRVAEICSQGLGMRLIGYDPYVSPAQGTTMNVQVYDNLADVLREADFLTIHTPLNNDTRGLLGAEELALLKPTAYLINASRGPIIDEDALLEVLREGRIAGAGLDVYDVEPIPYPHPLLELENVVLTPHIASFTEDGLRKMGVIVAQQVLMALSGERPQFVANPNVWEQGARMEQH